MWGIRRSTPRSQGDPAVGAAGEEGQGLVEYALILLFVAVALVSALGSLGVALIAQYNAIAGAIP
jgi:Flp pilus assembly pilin Flp